MRLLTATLTIMLVGALPALCGEEHEGHGDVAHHEGGDHAYQHEIALFLGATDEHGHDLEGTWGIEYAYSLRPKVAIGGILEYAGGDLRNTILAVPVFWKPVGDLLLIAAPGVEFHNGRGGGDHHKTVAGNENGDSDETYFLFRLGVGYTFHVGSRYSIIPQVNLDLVDGHEVWVGGVAFGVMF